ncbi:MAG: GtrA family protein [Kiritimatiellae bacterium]|nr:GtrA family protein [Kiritimatiellia bacterium]
MKDFFSKILSRDCGPFWQFVKYGTVGVLSTAVQTVVFYVLASTCLKCLAADDWAVAFLGLPSAEFAEDAPWYLSRGSLAAAATAIGFTVANVFCYVLNRRYVFTPGKYGVAAEFAMFFSAAALSTVAALALMKIFIDVFGMMTSLAVVAEIVISFLVNFVVRKFFIFKK